MFKCDTERLATKYNIRTKSSGNSKIFRCSSMPIILKQKITQFKDKIDFQTELQIF